MKNPICLRIQIIAMTVIMGLLVLAETTNAAIQLGSLFTDHLVLQRDMPVPVWGKVEPGAAVTVAFADQQKTTTVDAEGNWSVSLDPLEASLQPKQMKVSSSVTANPVVVSDVLVGETVVLKSDPLKQPLYVRYAFAGKPIVNLVNDFELPAYPFRTDDFQPTSTMPAKRSQSETSTDFPGEKSEFFGFDRYEVPLGEDSISVVCPKKSASGKPWIWRGMFWGSRMVPATQRTILADIEILKKGFHVVAAGGNPLGHPSGNAKMDSVYKLLTESHKLSKKPALVGLSRETLSVYRWASANPEKVGCIYIDNGVCVLKSWPGGKLVPGSDATGSGSPKQWAAMKQLYGFKSDAEALDYQKNPIDLLEPLAKAGVPLLHVCGSADTTVPYEENTAIVKQRYQTLGGSIQVILKEDADHHPHGLEDPTPIIDFILQSWSHSGKSTSKSFNRQ